MAIGVAQDPAAARTAANMAFADRQLPSDHNFADVLEPSAEIGSLPIYNLSVLDLVKSAFGNASHTGWRYARLQQDGRIGDTIELDLAPAPAIVSHAGGKTAARLRDAGLAAVEDVAGEDAAATDYDARILRVPEIGIEALWLSPRTAGSSSRFFGLPASQADLKNEKFVEFAIGKGVQYLERLARMANAG